MDGGRDRWKDGGSCWIVTPHRRRARPARPPGRSCVRESGGIRGIDHRFRERTSDAPMPVAGRDLLPIDALFDVEEKKSATACLLSHRFSPDSSSGPFAVRRLGRFCAANAVSECRLLQLFPSPFQAAKPFYCMSRTPGALPPYGRGASLVSSILGPSKWTSGRGFTSMDWERTCRMNEAEVDVPFRG